MLSLFHDLRFALRTFVKSPAFAIVTVLTLALGIGANTAIFSVVNSVLLRPFPFPEAERLVFVWETHARLPVPYMFASPPNYADWQSQNNVFEGIGAYWPRKMALTGGGDPEQIDVVRASATLLAVLGIQPALGRGFSEEDDRAGAAPVAVISDAMWRRRFAADRGVLGQSITLDGEAHTIIGVMPPGFWFPPPVSLEGPAPSARAEALVPFRMSYGGNQRGAHFMFAVARLKSGVQLEAAQSAMAAIAERLARAYPATNTGWGLKVVPLHAHALGRIEAGLLLLLGAVGAVLLIACVNVSNLMLARAVGRQREIAVRMAMGASRGRLVRQLLTESCALAAVGGALGFVIGLWGMDALVALAPQNLPRLGEISMDWRVLIFAGALSLGSGILFGLAPLAQMRDLQFVEALKEGARGSSSRGRGLRNALVIGEVALSMLLLVGAGLLIRSFLNLRGVDLGFHAQSVLTFRIDLPAARYPQGSQRSAFFAQVLERVRQTAGVESAAFINELPLAGDREGTSFTIEGRPAAPDSQAAHMNFSSVSPDYFRAMGVALRRGRVFSEADHAEAPPVVLVNETLAARYFKGEDPIGQRIRIGFTSDKAREIVGVVADVRFDAVETAENPTVYAPHAQMPRQRSASFVLRSALPPQQLWPGVRAAVRDLDPLLPVVETRSMGEVVSAAIAQPRFSTLLLGFFAALALALASIGIYGVIACNVTERTREIGIRMALGAKPGDVLRMVLTGGMRLTLIGVVIGSAAALALGGIARRLLFGIAPTDPLTFIAVGVVLTSIAASACWIPARRAMRVDPMVALRYE